MNADMARGLVALDTPCFVFDGEQLDANFRDFQGALERAWSPAAHVAYSVKTNPLPWVLGVARAAGCWAEVVSDDEYDLALTCGFALQHIVFNGPVKGRARFFEALQGGSVVNVDSQRELDWLAEYAAGSDDAGVALPAAAEGAGSAGGGEGPKRREGLPGAAIDAAGADIREPLAIGLRVGIDLERLCPGQTVTGAAGGRFGFCYENGQLARAIDAVRACGPAVRIAGLHMHVTTRSRSLEAYRALAQVAARIVREFSLDVAFIDIGGGFYGGGPGNAGAYDHYARVLAEELRPACDPAQVALLVEPGGAVACTPGFYAGRVVDAKDTAHGRFVTTELSRINIDHEMKKESYVHTLLDECGRALVAAETRADGGNVAAEVAEAGEAAGDTDAAVQAAGNAATSPLASGPAAARPCLDKQVICGYTCMESDRLCILEGQPELRLGDMMVVHNAGAYSMSFTPGFFIWHPPAVYAWDGQGDFELVRPLQGGDGKAER